MTHHVPPRSSTHAPCPHRPEPRYVSTAKTSSRTNGNRIKIVDTDNSSALLPTSDATTFDRLCFEFWLWIGSLALYTARYSLKHGNEAAVTAETMTCEERLPPVSTLSLVRALVFFLSA